MRNKFPEALAIIRRKQVEARTGLARSTIYSKMAEGTFPKPVNIGPRAVGWVESEITDWLNTQVEQSRSKTGRKAAA
ncbi:AlpA family transcriptional regulator [Thiobacillus sp.]|uniref:AlpA family transcriptional regulator n=1 Tax=Thiobacillus sp. TaxID=924 RepID=UPI00286EB017|nr:AlpA family transcriptional regulator [Thiobacillus sp.]